MKKRKKSEIDKEIRLRVLEEANIFISQRSTVRAVANQCDVSKTTVHKDLRERLPNLYPHLVKKVDEIFEENLIERTARGGEATRQKFLKKISLNKSR